MTDDILEKIKEQNKEETINAKVDAFISALKQYDFLHLIKVLFRELYRAAKTENVERVDELRWTIGYAQAIYSATIFSEDAKPINDNELKSLLELANDAIDASRVHGTLNRSKNYNDTLLFYAKQYEICENKTYPCFAHWIIGNLMSHQESLLRKTYGITFEEFKSGLENLSVFVERIMHNEATKSTDALSPSELFSVKKITHWPDELIDDLTFNNGEEKTFLGREKYKGWFDIEMPTSKRPFVKAGNESFVFSHSICFDNLYRNLKKAICSKYPSNQKEWNINQSKASEELAAWLLAKPLPGSKTFTNNFYKESKGNWIENDGILIFENVLFLFEVKAGSYTPRSVDLDPESHKKSVKDLIRAPLEQCERFINTLTKNRTLTIYTKQHEAKITLERDDFNWVFQFAIALDPIGELATSYNTLSDFRNDFKETFPLSIYDLTTYSFFFDSPLFFLHFLKERLKSIDIEKFVNDDELNYLGSYLSNRHFNCRLHELHKEVEQDIKKTYHVWLTDMCQDIDEYFDNYMRTEKPKFDVPDFVNDIILCLDKQQGKDRIKLAFHLLDGDRNLLEGIEESSKQIIQRQKVTKKFEGKISYLKGHKDFTPIQIYCNTSTENYATDEKMLGCSVAMLETLNIKQIYYLLLTIDEGKVIDAKCKLVSNSDKYKINPLEYATYVRRIKTTASDFQNNSALSKAKVSRNAPCPCGSGMKYKRCCNKEK